jgi:hypothetical protein
MGVTTGLTYLATPLVIVGEVDEGLNDLSVQPLSLEEHPLLKQVTIAGRESLQELTLIQCDHLLHTTETGETRPSPTVAMSSARFGERGEAPVIQPVIAVDVELDGTTTDEKEGSVTFTVCSAGLSCIAVANGLS